MTVLASFNQTRTARRCGAAAVALREHHGGVIAGARRHTDEHSERADPVDRALRCHGSKPASLVKCSGVHGLTGGAGGAVATVLNRRALSCRWRGAHHRRSYRRRRHRLASMTLQDRAPRRAQLTSNTYLPRVELPRLRRRARPAARHGNSHRIP